MTTASPASVIHSDEWYAKEYAKCAHNEWYFVTEYCYVRVPGTGAVKWKNWRHQEQLLQLLNVWRRVIVLKARQLGVSWLMAAHALWLCTFRPASNVMFFSKGQTEAIEMKNRAKFIHDHLPEFLQLEIGKDNDDLLTFPQMDSKIQSFPATEDAGRGETATLVVLDEWASMFYARSLYVALLPTVEHGTLIGISTAKGTGNLFHEIYAGAKKGENSFAPVFIPYNIIEGRDEAFRKNAERDMPGFMALQEYPEFEAEAFLVAGSCMFDVARLKRMPVTNPIAAPFPDCEIYAPFDPTHRYGVGVDTALGVNNASMNRKDWSVCKIMDLTTGEQAAKCRSQKSIEEFAKLSYMLLEMYGFPYVVPEELPHGRLWVNEVTTGYLDEERTIPMRYPKHQIHHRSRNVPCFSTNRATRKDILANLDIGMRSEQGITIYSQDTVNEFLAFGYNAEEDKFEAMIGHDDEVMAMALAWYILRLAPPAFDDFTPKSYVNKPGGRSTKREILIPITKVSWKSSNLENQQTVDCPTCGGEKTRMDGSGITRICGTCKGAGQMIRRTIGKD